MAINRTVSTTMPWWKVVTNIHRDENFLVYAQVLTMTGFCDSPNVLVIPASMVRLKGFRVQLHGSRHVAWHRIRSGKYLYSTSFRVL